MRDMFENLHQLMLPTLQQKNVELEIILQNPDLSYELDATLIEQVLINLLVNAIEAVRDKANPRIQLSAFAAGNSKINIKVADNGCGIPPSPDGPDLHSFFQHEKKRQRDRPQPLPADPAPA